MRPPRAENKLPNVASNLLQKAVLRRKMLPDLPMVIPARMPQAIRSAALTWKYCVIPLALFFSLFALSGCNREARFRKLPVFYDFVENFPLAEVQQEVSLIDFGTPAADKH